MRKENPFADLVAPEQLDEENPFADLVAPEQERFGTMRDVGRGVIAAPITLTQGIVELGALATDLFLDTDNSRRVTEAFEGAKEFLGATPEGTAGKAVEEIAAFGLGFIPIAGWLGRASSVARGARAANAPAAQSGFMRSAEAFGRSDTGRAMLNTRGRLAGTTALAAVGYEAIVSPDGYGTVADAFDVLPEFLQTEARDEEVTGREDAFRQLRNRLRRGAEAGVFSGAVDTALIGGARAAPVVMQTPVIGPGISAAARGARTAFDAAGSALGRIPGATTVNQAFKRYFTAAGGVDARLFEELSDARALPNAAKKEGLDYFNAWEKAVSKTLEGMKLFGRGKRGVERAQEDLRNFLTGQDFTALDKYDPSVKAAAEKMQEMLTRFEDRLLVEVDEALALRGADFTPAPGAGPSGFDKLEATRDAILERRNAAANISGLENAQSTYLRRRFEMYEAPERFYANMDPRFMETPVFRQAKDEVSFHLGIEGDAAQEKVLEYMGLRMLNGDPNLTPQKALELVRNGLRDARTGKTSVLAKETSGIDAVTSMFLPREPLLDKSPALRKLLGEVTDPKQLYMETLDALSTTVANVKFARTLKNSDLVMPAGDALASLSKGGRPMLVDLQALPTPDGRTADLDSQIAQLQQLGYRPLGDTADSYAHPFSGKYGELTGLYAPPEVHDALNMGVRLAQGPLGEIAALATMAKALSQQMTVVMNPLSQIRNALGGFYFLGGNANFGRNMDFTDAVNMVATSMADMTDDGLRVLTRHMQELGVADTALLTSQIRQLKNLGSDLAFSERVLSTVDKTIDKFIPFSKLLNRTYSDVDTAFKIMNTLGEESKLLNTLSRAKLDETNPLVQQAMLENGLAVRAASTLDPSIPFSRVYAAEVTKEVMPTYPRVVQAVRAVDMTPFFGAFVSFAAENIRNSGNTLGRGLKELAFSVSPQIRAKMGEEAARLFEQGVRAQGANRLTSYLAVATVAPAAVTAASARAVGMTEQDVNASYQLVADYIGERGHALAFTDFDRASGKVEYVDQSYVNPYAFTTDGARAALRAYHRDGVLDKSTAERIASAAWSGIATYAEPFGTESLVFERLRDVLPSGWVGRGGESPTGLRIYGAAENLGDKLQKSFNHVVGGFLPGYFREIAQPRQGVWQPGRLTRAMTDTPGGQGQEFSLQEEAARLVSGFTPMVLDLKRDFWYNGAEYSSLRAEARSIASNVIKRNDSTEPQMLRAWEGYLDNLYRHQSSLYADVLAARQLGLSEADIIRQLIQKSKLGSAEASMIARGRFYPSGPSQDTIRDIRREVIAEGQRRVVANPPFVEFQRMTNEQRNRPLSPQLGVEAREARFVDFVDNLRDPNTQEVSTPAATVAAPQTQGAAPAAPVVDQVPAAPGPQPSAQQAGTQPPFELLGGNPFDALRNLPIAQRFLGQ